MNYFKGRLHFNDNDVQYHLSEVGDMQVIRLKSDIQRAAMDFSSFYEASDRAPTAIFCAPNELCESAHVPDFMRTDTHGRLHFLTLRTCLAYWSQFHIQSTYEGAKAAQNAASKVSEVIAQWIADGTVALQVPGKYGGSGRLERLVVGDLGHVSDVAKTKRHDVVTASGYSVIDNEECLLPFQCIRDPIGFRASNGTIASAPLYGRPALLRTDEGFSVVRMDLNDVEVDIPSLGLSRISSRTVPTRLFGRQDGRTSPVGRRAVDLVIVEDQIVAICRGGGTVPPKAGFLIRASEDIVGPEAIRSLGDDNRVVIRVPSRPGIVAGIQCGPHLMDHGLPLEQDRQLREERFIVERRDPEAIPVGLQDSVGPIRAARTIAIVRRDGSLGILVVEGTASGIANGRELSAVSAFGATFAEVVEIAKREDGVGAMALDSGGSVSLYVRGERIIENGDYRKTLVRHERPLAHALAFQWS